MHAAVLCLHMYKRADGASSQDAAERDLEDHLLLLLQAKQERDLAQEAALARAAADWEASKAQAAGQVICCCPRPAPCSCVELGLQHNLLQHLWHVGYGRDTAAGAKLLHVSPSAHMMPFLILLVPIVLTKMAPHATPKSPQTTLPHRWLLQASQRCLCILAGVPVLNRTLAAGHAYRAMN